MAIPPIYIILIITQLLTYRRADLLTELRRDNFQFYDPHVRDTQCRLQCMYISSNQRHMIAVNGQWR